MITELETVANERMLFLGDLFSKVQLEINRAKERKVIFPVEISIQKPGSQSHLTLLLWNRFSWHNAHFNYYKYRITHKEIDSDPGDFSTTFLQNVGDEEEKYWFLPAINAGVFNYYEKPSIKTNLFYEAEGLQPNLFKNSAKISGLIKPNHKTLATLGSAKMSYTESMESNVLFDLDSLFSAAVTGFSVFSLMKQNKLRLYQVQQIYDGPDCVNFSLIDLQSESYALSITNPRIRIPCKGLSELIEVILNRESISTIKNFLDIYFLFHNTSTLSIVKNVPVEGIYLHKKTRYLFQWNNKFIPDYLLSTCIKFLFLGTKKQFDESGYRS